MFEEIENEATGKIIWLWRLMIWIENNPNHLAKCGQIAWYNKNRETEIWQLDITFWPPAKDGSHVA
jgi:hypothetical protein